MRTELVFQTNTKNNEKKPAGLFLTNICIVLPFDDNSDMLPFISYKFFSLKFVRAVIEWVL